jgi:hypothetical protein
MGIWGFKATRFNSSPIPNRIRLRRELSRTVVARKLQAGHLKAVNSAAEVKLDLIGYVTAKIPFNSPDCGF